MAINENYLEIRDYTGPGYQPLIDFESWRVAFLRFSDSMLPENIHQMERHDETDEVFILLEGRCLLFIGEGRDTLQDLYAIDMQPLKLYNVKKSCWHTSTLSQDTTVLIIENRDTTLLNSPRLPLTPAQREQIMDLANQHRS